MGDNPAQRLLDRHVLERGEKTALLCDGCSISYAELYARGSRYAAILQTSNTVPGDRVLIALPDGPEFVCAFLGSILAGLVPVPCSDLLDRETLDFLLRDCRATTLFGLSGSCAADAVSPELKQTFPVDSLSFRGCYDAAPSYCRPYPTPDDADCFMLYTSGSTGTPKGIAHGGGVLLPEADHLGREILAITPDDILLSVSKMHFGFGLLNSVVHGLGGGATVALISGKPTLQTLRQAISGSRPTLLFAVPAVYTLLLDAAHDLFHAGPLRLCVSSGETLAGDLFQGWRERTGIEIIDSVGATETFHAVIANRPGSVVPGAAGTVIPPWEARIVDEAGNAVLDGSPGYLEVRGPALAPRSGTENRSGGDGWLRTGDMFQADDGVFTFAGRGDDMFKCDGNWVSPLPIENALRLHPAVEECAVRARRILGAARPEAHIVLHQGIHESTALERDLFLFLRSRLPDHMCPVQFIFHTELPRTITGKLRRGLLNSNAHDDRNCIDR